MSLNRIQPWQPEWLRFAVRQIAARADRLATNSNHVRAWYIKRGLPGETFVVLPPGVADTGVSPARREVLLRELQLPADARLIGVVGPLTHEKRVKDLIWAADLLRVLHDNLRLLIIGDGPLRAQLEEYARLASDLDHVHFLGHRPDVGRIMPHLDVLWDGSESEGASDAILLAMAAGVPVVASDTPANRELVVENATGFFTPLGIRAGRATRARFTDQIFRDAALASRLSSKARERASRQFGAQRCLEKYEEMYSELANSRFA